MTKDLVPWVTQNLQPPAGSQPLAPLTGAGQNWLIGFSKSGIGGQDLILKHPDLFAAAASWDFPADMGYVQRLRHKLGGMTMGLTPTSRRITASRRPSSTPTRRRS